MDAISPTYKMLGKVGEPPGKMGWTRSFKRTFYNCIKIRSSIESLAFFPLMGHPGHMPGTLEFVVPGLPYMVVYRIIEEEMHILNIFHGAQER